jgi:hypothetical protein
LRRNGPQGEARSGSSTARHQISKKPQPKGWGFLLYGKGETAKQKQAPLLWRARWLLALWRMGKPAMLLSHWITNWTTSSMPLIYIDSETIEF